MADDNKTRDWAADCNGEGQERVVRDGGDSGVAMMAVAAEDAVKKKEFLVKKHLLSSHFLVEHCVQYQLI